MIKRRVDRIRRRREEERVTIWGRHGDATSRNIAAGARTIFDDEGLTESLR
jgi:hypothetical protein